MGAQLRSSCARREGIFAPGQAGIDTVLDLATWPAHEASRIWVEDSPARTNGGS